jgi:hypothetical protein
VFSRVLELVATPRWPRDELEAAGRIYRTWLAPAPNLLEDVSKDDTTIQRTLSTSGSKWREDLWCEMAGRLVVK